jgi:hypothetical protein
VRLGQPLHLVHQLVGDAMVQQLHGQLVTVQLGLRSDAPIDRATLAVLEISYGRPVDGE